MLPIFVVNLERDHVRRARIERLLEANGLCASFRPAVDGAQLDATRIAAVYDSSRNSSAFKRPLSKPEIGCYLSHFALWTEIAEGDAPGAIVLEDDIEAMPGLKDVLERISQIELGTSVVKLYAPHLGLKRRLAALPFEHVLVAPWIAPACTTGYVISREAARKMAENALPFARPVDLDIKHWWEFGISVLAVSPSVVRPANCDGGSIEADRRKVRGQYTWFERFVRNLKYQARFHSRLLRAFLLNRRARLADARRLSGEQRLSSVQLP